MTRTDRPVDRPGPDVESVLRHELGEVADGVARLPVARPTGRGVAGVVSRGRALRRRRRGVAAGAVLAAAAVVAGGVVLAPGDGRTAQPADSSDDGAAVTREVLAWVDGLPGGAVPLPTAVERDFGTTVDIGRQ